MGPSGRQGAVILAPMGPDVGAALLTGRHEDSR